MKKIKNCVCLNDLLTKQRRGGGEPSWLLHNAPANGREKKKIRQHWPGHRTTRPCTSEEVSVKFFPPLSTHCASRVCWNPGGPVDEASFSLEPVVAAHSVVVLRLKAGPIRYTQRAERTKIRPSPLLTGLTSSPTPRVCQALRGSFPSTRVVDWAAHIEGVE